MNPDDHSEYDEREGAPEEYVKPRLETLGTLVDATAGPNSAPGPDGGPTFGSS